VGEHGGPGDDCSRGTWDEAWLRADDQDALLLLNSWEPAP
jgi:hypothetical protein